MIAFRAWNYAGTSVKCIGGGRQLGWNWSNLWCIGQQERRAKKLRTMALKILDFNRLTELINCMLWQAMVKEKDFKRTGED